MSKTESNKTTSLEDTLGFLLEIDKLKSVNRRVYLSDQSRQENSAEHSWHLSMALWLLSEEAGVKIDIAHALKMSLIHDICEIDPGDVSAFDVNRELKHQKEAACITRICALAPNHSEQIMELWREYEANQSPESKWVKIADRIVPFMMNLASEGKAWKEQDVSKSQVIAINKIISVHYPELYNWFLSKIDYSVSKGWLKDL